MLRALHFRATITVGQYCFYHVGETVSCKFLEGEKYCAGVLLELESVSLVVSLCAPAGLHRVAAFQPGTKPVEGNLRWLFPLETRPGLWHAHADTHTHIDIYSEPTLLTTFISEKLGESSRKYIMPNIMPRHNILGVELGSVMEIFSRLF